MPATLEMLLWALALRGWASCLAHTGLLVREGIRTQISRGMTRWGLWRRWLSIAKEKGFRRKLTPWCQGSLSCTPAWHIRKLCMWRTNASPRMCMGTSRSVWSDGRSCSHLHASWVRVASLVANLSCNLLTVFKKCKTLTNQILRLASKLYKCYRLKALRTHQ